MGSSSAFVQLVALTLFSSLTEFKQNLLALACVRAEGRSLSHGVRVDMLRNRPGGPGGCGSVGACGHGTVHMLMPQ